MILPKRRKPEKHKIGPQVRSDPHLKWIRGFTCAVANKGGCGGRTEAAHVRTGTDGGMGVKPSDCHVIPLCSIHHGLQHQWGEAEFERRYDIDMKKIANAMWQRSPCRIKLK